MVDGYGRFIGRRAGPQAIGTALSAANRGQPRSSGSAARPGPASRGCSRRPATLDLAGHAAGPARGDADAANARNAPVGDPGDAARGVGGRDRVRPRAAGSRPHHAPARARPGAAEQRAVATVLGLPERKRRERTRGCGRCRAALADRPAGWRGSADHLRVGRRRVRGPRVAGGGRATWSRCHRRPGGPDAVLPARVSSDWRSLENCREIRSGRWVTTRSRD